MSSRGRSAFQKLHDSTHFWLEGSVLKFMSTDLVLDLSSETGALKVPSNGNCHVYTLLERVMTSCMQPVTLISTVLLTLQESLYQLERCDWLVFFSAVYV